MRMTGIIKDDGSVETDDGKLFQLPIRGTAADGFPEALFDATPVGGRGAFARQSIKPYVGMRTKIFTNDGIHGYNFVILANDER